MPYVGEIRIFAGNFAPSGWMFCNGQLLPIDDNETLFQLIGTSYGGDGQQTFALPDLRGRLAIHRSPALPMATTVGVERVTLTANQLPVHGHPLMASTAPATAAGPANRVLGTPPSVTAFIRESPSTQLPATAISGVGGSQPHENRMPSVAVHHIISLFGEFPSQ